MTAQQLHIINSKFPLAPSKEKHMELLRDTVKHSGGKKESDKLHRVAYLGFG